MTEIEQGMPGEKQVLKDEYHPKQPVHNLSFVPEQDVFVDSLPQQQERDLLPNEALRKSLANASDEEREQFVKRHLQLAKKYNGPGGP